MFRTIFKTRNLAILLTIGLLAILASSFLWSYEKWYGLEDATMSVHGMIALIGGVVLSLILGLGLVGLMVYSNKKGHDDRAAQRQYDDRAGKEE